MKTEKYFLYATLGGEKVEREVTLAEFCEAERMAARCITSIQHSVSL